MSLANAVREKYPPEKIVEHAAQFLAAEDEKVAFAALQFLASYGYGKPKETLEIKSELTPEEYAEELAVIAREHIRSLPDEERIKLLTDPVTTDSIQ